MPVGYVAPESVPQASQFDAMAANVTQPLPDQLGAPRAPVTERGKRAAALRDDRNLG